MQSAWFSVLKTFENMNPELSKCRSPIFSSKALSSRLVTFRDFRISNVEVPDLLVLGTPKVPNSKMTGEYTSSLRPVLFLNSFQVFTFRAFPMQDC
jgi:hypothetical protein